MQGCATLAHPCILLIEKNHQLRYSLPHHQPPIAQLVERRAYTSVVLGSSPSWRTIKKYSPLLRAVLFYCPPTQARILPISPDQKITNAAPFERGVGYFYFFILYSNLSAPKSSLDQPLILPPPVLFYKRLLFLPPHGAVILRTLFVPKSRLPPIE